MSFRVHIVSQLILQSCRRSRLAQQCAAQELLPGCRGLLEVGRRLYWFSGAAYPLNLGSKFRLGDKLS
jgi:hypothetical protein